MRTDSRSREERLALTVYFSVCASSIYGPHICPCRNLNYKIWPHLHAAIVMLFDLFSLLWRLLRINRIFVVFENLYRNYNYDEALLPLRSYFYSIWPFKMILCAAT